MSTESEPTNEQARMDSWGEQPSFPMETIQFLQWAFGFHYLTIRQKVFTFAQKYYVYDEQGFPRFYVVRPPKIALNILAGIAGGAINILFLVYAFRLLFYEQQVVLAVVALIIGGNLAGVVRLMLAPYRDIQLFTDDTEQFPVLFLSQDNKIGLNIWFTIYDAAGMFVARARRNRFTALWRKTWFGETTDRRVICRISEDSLTLALLRRYLGPLLGFLRTNYDFQLPDGTQVGEYNRKLTLTDQYILDLRGDPDFLIDRRVALALAILLDTAEGR